MLRKILLPTLAIAALAGCATGYTYRDGNGDYYYGRPRVEYRYYDPYGYYPPYGDYGYRSGYYYDRFGRLVYGSPYGGYYGYPYGAGGWWYAPRPHHGHDGDGDHHDHDDDDDHADGRGDRRPPWRDIGGMLPRPPRAEGEEGDAARPRPRRQNAPLAMPMPQRESRVIAPREPRMDGDAPGGSRMGRVIRGAKASEPASEP